MAVRLAKLEREDRKDLPAALAALRAALQLDPLGEVWRSCVATVGEGPLGPEDAAAINTVIAELRRTLEREPLQVRTLECLRDLAALRGLSDLQAAASQLLSTMGFGSARGRVRDLHPAPVAERARRPGDLGNVSPALALMREVWPHFCKGVARLYAAPAADLGITRQTQLPPGSDPRLAWAESGQPGARHPLVLDLPAAGRRSLGGGARRAGELAGARARGGGRRPGLALPGGTHPGAAARTAPASSSASRWPSWS